MEAKLLQPAIASDVTLYEDVARRGVPGWGAGDYPRLWDSCQEGVLEKKRDQRKPSPERMWLVSLMKERKRRLPMISMGRVGDESDASGLVSGRLRVRPKTTRDPSKPWFGIPPTF